VSCPPDQQLFARDADALKHAQQCGRCQALLTAGVPLNATLDSQKTLRRDQPADDVLAEGTRVGEYVVARRIGSGAMGAVYAAFDPRLEREVGCDLADLLVMALVRPPAGGAPLSLCA